MTYPIWHHYLWPTELILRGVNLTTKKFVKSKISCEDERTIRHLNVSLSEATQVCTYSHRTPSDVGQCECVSIRGRLFACDHSRATKIFDSYSMDLSNYVFKFHACFSIIDYL
mmetsp:Transcript_80134/g.194305  ORF Transcript_80134/g.194305 Transcript_80134/m.194305 type:complete len:113 (-) Transcript_80134:607-945(-)